MNTPARFASVLIAALAIVSTGCSAETEHEDVVVDDAALSAFPAAAISAEVAYGDAFTQVAYTKTPRFRALRFHGSAGDTIKVRIRSQTAGTRSIGWLLAADFKTLAQVSGDAFTGTRDTYFEHELPSTGAFYVALREASLRDATFEVQIRGVGTQLVDPFDPASCAGPPLGPDQLRALLGATQERNLGRFELQYRERSCTTSACGAWTIGLAPGRMNCGSSYGAYYYPGCALPGELKLTYGSAGFQVGLGYEARYYTSSNRDNHLGALCTYEPDGTVACNAYGFLYDVDRSDFCRVHACQGDSRQQTFLELQDAGDGRSAESRQPKLRGALKNGCFRASATMGGQLGRTEWTESQVAVVVRF